MKKMYVFIRTRFEAVHCWKDCPYNEVSFLRVPHRHEFHVEVRFPVYHDDRDVEFIMAKHRVNEYIRAAWDGKDLGTMSCERMAIQLMERFKACAVTVSEDGENGAIIVNEEIE